MAFHGEALGIITTAAAAIKLLQGQDGVAAARLATQAADVVGDFFEQRKRRQASARKARAARG